MIHRTAVVETSDLGHDVCIGAYAVIGEGVRLGNNVIIHPHAVLEPGVIVGDGAEIFPFAYVGKEPKGAGALSRTPSFVRRVTIGANSSVGPHTVIYYGVEIGENTLVGDGASIREECQIGSRCVIGRQVTINYSVVIGDGTKIMDHSWLAGNMRIGANVFISGGVLTANDNRLGRQGYNEEHVMGPSFEDGVAIGVGAIVLPGVSVARGAIIAAGAVVTKNVKANTVVKGVPARVTKQLPE